MVKTAFRLEVLGSPCFEYQGELAALPSEGIKDSEVVQSALKYCNKLQSEVCLRQDEV